MDLLSVQTPQAGDVYVKRGLKLYPFVIEPSTDGWQPYHVLIKDLEPWIIPALSEKTQSFEQLMHSGQQDYNARRWKRSTSVF